MNFTHHDKIIDEITFKGLSTRFQRKLTLLVTIAIIAGLAITAHKAIKLIPVNQMTEMLTLFMTACMYIHYVLTGQFILKQWALSIACQLPLAKLYDQDKRIIEETKTKLIPLAIGLKGKDLTIHRRINPRLASVSIGEVIQHLHQLERWTVSAENTKKCADFVYQYVLVERWLQQQEIEQQECPFNQRIAKWKG